MDESLGNWKRFFNNWPEKIPQKGLLATTFGEQIPFDGFMIGEGFLLLKRQTPDSLGARMIVLPYQNISALKITDVLRSKALQSFGFEAVPTSK